MISYLKKALTFTICFVILLTFSACGEKEDQNDHLSGEKWQTTSGMLLDLAKDGSFKWYNDKSNRKDNYYSGNYTIRIGQEAIDYLEETQGLSEEGQRSTMTKFSVSDDCYYSVVLNNKECIQDGKNTLETENEIVYYGYYLPDYDTLKLYNIGNLNNYEFTKM